MSWFDPIGNKYRTSLVHKIFFVWLWPPIRWVLFHLNEETAHHLDIRGIAIVGGIETAWRYVKLPFQIILFPVAFPFFMWWHRKRIAALRAMDNTRNWSA